MSEENVEIVRELLGLWEGGDWEAGREFFDDSCEVVFSALGFPDPGAYPVGRAALRAWLDFTGSFETFATGVDQIIDAGERVVALFWVQARGRASGADVDAKVGAILTLLGGKIVRYVLTNRAEALQAAGLSE
jgi:ketosteroid isomerase-like protein